MAQQLTSEGENTEEYKKSYMKRTILAARTDGY